MLKLIFKWFKLDYQSTLEQYIISRNPKNEADIEKIIRDFERKTSLNF